MSDRFDWAEGDVEFTREPPRAPDGESSVEKAVDPETLMDELLDTTSYVEDRPLDTAWEPSDEDDDDTGE